MITIDEMTLRRHGISLPSYFLLSFLTLSHIFVNISSTYIFLLLFESSIHMFIVNVSDVSMFFLPISFKFVYFLLPDLEKKHCIICITCKIPTIYNFFILTENVWFFSSWFVSPCSLGAWF